MKAKYQYFGERLEVPKAQQKHERNTIAYPVSLGATEAVESINCIIWNEFGHEFDAVATPHADFEDEPITWRPPRKNPV